MSHQKIAVEGHDPPGRAKLQVGTQWLSKSQPRSFPLVISRERVILVPGGPRQCAEQSGFHVSDAGRRRCFAEDGESCALVVSQCGKVLDRKLPERIPGSLFRCRLRFLKHVLAAIGIVQFQQAGLMPGVGFSATGRV